MIHKIACYLSSHGFGHAVRSETVIVTMALEKPDWQFFIISGSPEFLFKRALQLPNVQLRSQATDFGLIQTNPRVINLTQTATELEKLLSAYPALVEREESFLRRESISALFCDIPFLPFLAGHNLSLPSAGMGNFTWDWIYHYYQQHNPVFEAAARLACRCYRHCGLYLSLPFSPGTTVFEQVKQIPLVCRQPGLPAASLKEELNIDLEHRVVLIGLSELTLTDKAISKIEKIPGTTFLLPSPLKLQLKNGLNIPAKQASFHSLLELADIILTKPGYGIISSAIASCKPLITTERGDFPEVRYLDRLLERTVGQTKLSMKRFDRGDWKKALKQATHKQFDFAINGTEIAAEQLIRYFTLLPPDRY